MDYRGMRSVMRYKERRTSDGIRPQLTLGQLITRLGDMTPSLSLDASICFDFEYACPTTLTSWRGSYEELALQFEFSGAPPSLQDLLTEVRSGVGRVFEGYKGGQYLMHESTPVWVSNYGHAGHTAIIGVFSNGYQVIIETAYCEF